MVRRLTDRDVPTVLAGRLERRQAILFLCGLRIVGSCKIVAVGVHIIVPHLPSSRSMKTMVTLLWSSRCACQPTADGEMTI